MRRSRGPGQVWILNGPYSPDVGRLTELRFVAADGSLVATDETADLAPGITETQTVWQYSSATNTSTTVARYEPGAITPHAVLSHRITDEFGQFIAQVSPENQPVDDVLLAAPLVFQGMVLDGDSGIYETTGGNGYLPGSGRFLTTGATFNPANPFSSAGGGGADYDPNRGQAAYEAQMKSDVYGDGILGKYYYGTIGEATRWVIGDDALVPETLSSVLP